MVGRLVNMERYVIVKFYRYCVGVVHSCMVYGRLIRTKTFTPLRGYLVRGENYSIWNKETLTSVRAAESHSFTGPESVHCLA